MEGKYYCGICGWVRIDLFPHCHMTTEQSADYTAKEDYEWYKAQPDPRAQEVARWYEQNKAHLIGRIGNEGKD